DRVRDTRYFARGNIPFRRTVSPGTGRGLYGRDINRATRPKVGRPGDASCSEARPYRPVRGGDRLPRREVPVVHDGEGAEDQVHVPRPGNVPAGRADREVPGRAEFVIDLPRGAVLRRDGVDRPRGIVHGVRAVVLEGVGEDFRRVRLQAHRVHID